MGPLGELSWEYVYAIEEVINTHITVDVSESNNTDGTYFSCYCIRFYLFSSLSTVPSSNIKIMRMENGNQPYEGRKQPNQPANHICI